MISEVKNMSTKMFIWYVLVLMISGFSGDNCSLTGFTVADAFWLSQRLVDIDKMTHVLGYFLVIVLLCNTTDLLCNTRKLAEIIITLALL